MYAAIKTFVEPSVLLAWLAILGNDAGLGWDGGRTTLTLIIDCVRNRRTSTFKIKNGG